MMKGLFIGLTSIDLIYALPGFPEENTKNKCEGPMIDIGGPATNAAFTFAALGGTATLVSLIGRNSFSAFMNEKLEQYGIRHLDLDATFRGDPELASIIVNGTNGSRTIVSSKPKTATVFRPPAVNLGEFDIICLDGFYGEYATKLLRGHRGGSPVVFDGGSYKPYTEDLIEYLTYPIFSEKFAMPDGRSLHETMTAKGILNYAITKGEQPIEVYEKERNYRLPVEELHVKDTLGAGDIFHGAFCWYILQERADFRTALKKAGKIAGLSCQFSGTREWTRLI